MSFEGGWAEVVQGGVSSFGIVVREVASARPITDLNLLFAGNSWKKVLEDETFFVLARIQTQGKLTEQEVIFEE